MFEITKKYGVVKIEREFMHYVAYDSLNKAICTADTYNELITSLHEEDQEYMESHKEED